MDSAASQLYFIFLFLFKIIPILGDVPYLSY
jgi:hypothetical protein